MIAVPAQPVLAFLGDRTLRVGDQGYDVQQLQQDLGYLGYPIGQVDGRYGWNTFEAVKRFQADNGLVVDGITGKATAQQLIKQVSTPLNSDANTTPVATNAGDANPSRGGLALRISQGDIYDLARLVHGEARGESFEGKVAIVRLCENLLQIGPQN